MEIGEIIKIPIITNYVKVHTPVVWIHKTKRGNKVRALLNGNQKEGDSEKKNGWN